MADLPTVAVRWQLNVDVPWQTLSTLRRYEIVAPKHAGPVLGIPRTVVSVHGQRSSLLFRIGGGHLRQPMAEILARLKSEAHSRIQDYSVEPAEYVQGLVSWLESELAGGILQGTYTTVVLLAVVSDAAIWVWHVGPNGVVCGTTSRFQFCSTDTRYPVLRQAGMLKSSGLRSAGSGPREHASSIYCMGTPLGYEGLRIPIQGEELVIAFERGTLPFGPWPSRPFSIDQLWTMEAAWWHGLQGSAMVIGPVTSRDLRLRQDWTIDEIPLEE